MVNERLAAFYDEVMEAEFSRDVQADFRAVFFGQSTPEQGRRVLKQIMLMCDGSPVSEVQAESHGVLAYKAGQRAIGAWIAQIMADRRTTNPTQTVNEEPDDGGS